MITLERMPTGDRGTLTRTVPTMARLIREGAKAPSVRRVADTLAANGASPEAFATQAYNWVRTVIDYQNDPLDVEYIRTPARMMELASQGRAEGDCDDYVVTLGALLGSRGIQTRLVVVRNEPGGLYAHVYLEAKTPSGWIPLDAIPPRRPAGTAPGQLGRRAFDVGLAGEGEAVFCPEDGALASWLRAVAFTGLIEVVTAVVMSSKRFRLGYRTVAVATASWAFNRYVWGGFKGLARRVTS